MIPAVQYSYLATFLWGGIVILSWIGYGGLLERSLLPREHDQIDWGLKCGWGISFSLAIGGFLLLAHVAVAAILAALTLVGLVLFFWTTRLRHRAPWLAILIIAVPLLIVYLMAVNRPPGAFNGLDDNPLYLPLVRRILQTGTLIERFSWRRMLAYGGHSYLQAVTTVLGSASNMLLLERGICAMVMAGLTWGMLRPTTRLEFAIALAITLGAGLYPVAVTNSHSARTGAVLFLTLVRTLGLESWDKILPSARALLVALVAIGACTLRASYLPAAALTVAASYLFRVLLDRGRTRALIVEAVQCAVWSIVLLAPWALVLYQSSGTPIYPGISGNAELANGVFQLHLPPAQPAMWIAHALLNPRIVLFVLPVVFVLNRKYVPSIFALYVASLVTCVMLANSLTALDTRSVARYAAPILFAAAVASVGVVIGDRRRIVPGLSVRASQLTVAGTMGVMALALAIVFSYQFKHQLASGNNPWFDFKGGPLGGEALADEYRRGQDAVPAGKAFIAYVERPYLFDYRRNPIDLLDEGTGLASPPPGIPRDDDPHHFADYLKTLGIRYVVLADFDHASIVWNRQWLAEKVADRTVTPGAHHDAEMELNFMQRLEALADIGQEVFHDGAIRVIRLP